MGRSPTIHSRKYSPSKSGTWLNCPLSTLLNDGGDQEINPRAEFGTQCHELGSALISKSLKLFDYENETQHIDELIKGLDMYSDEMQEIADGYANFVIKTFEFEKSQTEDEPLIVIEQFLDMDFDEDAKGTLDCGIISALNGGTLTVMDLKTGRIPVYAFDKESGLFNTQLGIYALYFYKTYKHLYPIKNVRLVIYQPVTNNTNDYEMSIEDLLVFETMVLIPAVEKTKVDNPEANPGDYCRFCSGNAVCKKRAEVNLKTMQEINKSFNTMTDEEINGLLPKLDEFIIYAEDVKKYALKKAQKGHKWSDFKLVHTRRTRTITNEDEVIRICKEAGIDPFVSNKLAGITELTKRIGKDKVNNLIGPYIDFKLGSMILVPNKDPREEVEINREGD